MPKKQGKNKVDKIISVKCLSPRNSKKQEKSLNYLKDFQGG